MSTGQGYTAKSPAIASEASATAPQLKGGVQKDVLDPALTVPIEEKHPIRTTRGLWIFDKILYNLTNLSVFALSVFVTYKTNYSNDGNFLEARTKKAVGFLQKKGIVASEQGARDLNMVLWSFIDGSIAAPFVALLKRRRSEIGHWIDDKLGTTPADLSVYDQQPKEGWMSVITGRIAAFSIVIPTCFLFSAKDRSDPKSVSVNEVLFEKPAKWIVNHNLSGVPGRLKRAFPKLNVEGLSVTSIFEIVYTTICTTVLFAVSYLTGKHAKDKSDRMADEAKSVGSGSGGGAPAGQAALHGQFSDVNQEAAAQKHAKHLSGKAVSHLERYQQGLPPAGQPLTVAP